MQPTRLVALAVTLFGLCLSNAFGWSNKYKQGFALSQIIKSSDLVVIGSVAQKEFVYRENMDSKFTTDISIDVDHLLKGTPNAGKNRVRFMIKGGEGVNPRTGDVELWLNSDTPEFTIGERALLFLYHSKSPIFANYPYDQLLLHRGIYGKNGITNDKVSLLLPLDDNSLRVVKMPVDLVVPLAKAAVKDKDKMILLEDEIKDALQGQPAKMPLSQDVIDSIKGKAKQINEKNPQPGTSGGSNDDTSD